MYGASSHPPLGLVPNSFWRRKVLAKDNNSESLPKAESSVSQSPLRILDRGIRRRHCPDRRQVLPSKSRVYVFHTSRSGPPGHKRNRNRKRRTT
ncbi:hypothetical protein ATCV1_z753L [Acanthocystis turfacea chlorella virus 1]|uniref:Uncharacterized protein z753L n=1 Tax=Chlorovirus heliozoae TaxID=322019 RepID=A7KA13_9PHYC|nr:hypothetical protein ATCV1_z753L [Acanthocystis turfacea chlorella virus 1]ABT16887.1 hypothetical protein ATCV1_z753L [Acanthocystis turfacea chlorella virus 1]